MEHKVDEQYRLLKEQSEKLKRVNERIIDIFATAVEYRDAESGQHIQRVKSFTRIIAEELAKQYPEYGLTPSKIEAIVSVADCYDALISERVYKSAYALDKAFNMIINGECGMFSPKIIFCFQEAREKFEQKALELQE
ncbi:MAG: hypothetical protein MRZ36_05460 [Eubacterium sp.]|nr:hypothetical protein [Eubacterium sp.]